MVDDDNVTRAVLSGFFKSNKYKILEAPDLVSARKILTSTPVHLVLLDVNLPDGNGLEFFVKERELFPKITKTIIISSKDERKFIQKALEYGVDDYLTKPVKNVELLSKAKKIFLKQPQFSKMYTDKKIIAKVPVEIIGIGETELVIKATVNFGEGQEVDIHSPYLKEVGLDRSKLIHTDKYNGKIRMSSSHAFSILGTPAEALKKLRSTIIQWKRLL